jgi:hypothetical protein
MTIISSAMSHTISILCKSHKETIRAINNTIKDYLYISSLSSLSVLHFPLTENPLIPTINYVSLFHTLLANSMPISPPTWISSFFLGENRFGRTNSHRQGLLTGKRHIEKMWVRFSESPTLGSEIWSTDFKSKDYSRRILLQSYDDPCCWLSHRRSQLSPRS